VTAQKLRPAVFVCKKKGGSKNVMYSEQKLLLRDSLLKLPFAIKKIGSTVCDKKS
jgi:hypothetical protein